MIFPSNGLDPAQLISTSCGLRRARSSCTNLWRRKKKAKPPAATTSRASSSSTIAIIGPAPKPGTCFAWSWGNSGPTSFKAGGFVGRPGPAACHRPSCRNTRQKWAGLLLSRGHHPPARTSNQSLHGLFQSSPHRCCRSTPPYHMSSLHARSYPQLGGGSIS